MRMSAAILMLALPVTAAVAEEPVPAPSSRMIVGGAPAQRCAPGNGTAQYRPGSLSMQPLGEMPSAARVRAVYRTVGKCPEPIVLERGIGANKHKQLPIGGLPESSALDR